MTCRRCDCFSTRSIILLTTAYTRQHYRLLHDVDNPQEDCALKVSQYFYMCVKLLSKKTADMHEITQ